MKTVTGIPCNDYLRIPKTQYDRIVFRFVNDDTNTPASCTLRLGDTDPMTGEAITNVDFFTEYNRMVNRQVYKNLKAVKTDLTPEERNRFREEKAAFAEAFEKEYGYEPARSDLRDALASRWPKTYHLSIQEMTNEDGDDKSYLHPELSTPAPDPFGENEPDEITCLREVAASLTGRLADVYEALLVQYAGGQETIPFTSLAEKWGVPIRRIYRDRDRIFRMIRETIATAQKSGD